MTIFYNFKYNYCLFNDYIKNFIIIKNYKNKKIFGFPTKLILLIFFNFSKCKSLMICPIFNNSLTLNFKEISWI